MFRISLKCVKFQKTVRKSLLQYIIRGGEIILTIHGVIIQLVHHPCLKTNHMVFKIIKYKTKSLVLKTCSRCSKIKMLLYKANLLPSEIWKGKSGKLQVPYLISLKVIYQATIEANPKGKEHRKAIICKSGKLL